MKLGDIAVDGPDAGRFSFSFEPDVGELADSMEAIGLVRPPLLRNSGGRLEVVCGLKRVLACKSVGVAEIEALVCEADELSDERCLWFSLIDNDSPGQLSALERAIAPAKFFELGYDAERIVQEIAPRLGLPLSRRYIEDCLKLPSLEEEILRAVHGDFFGIDQALCLLKLEARERLSIFRLLHSCRANLNETRELISLIPDVAAMKRLAVRRYVELELEPIVNDESLPPRKRLERLREHLKKARYPRLTTAESAFKTTIGEMKLDDRCRINAPKHFEGDEITITIKARDAQQVEEILGMLSSARAKQGLGKLFSIIRGSKHE